MTRDLPDQLRRRAARFHARLLGALAGRRPIPFAYWSTQQRAMRFLFDRRDPLTFPLDGAITIGSAVRSPELRELFRSEPPTNWALDPSTIDLIWTFLERDRPRAVVECGAGTSTLLLTTFAKLNGSEAPLVVSLEQDAAYARDVRQKLARHGLDRFADIIHAPLDGECRYTFDPRRALEKLGGRRFDWIMIDGPSGPEGCRAHTLPTIAPLCAPGARWFLDDAFRDSEMEALREWTRLPGIHVEGIHPVGKGLATGIISDPGKVVAP